nr:hypothetical protein [Lachnospiraceae bacterium]
MNLRKRSSKIKLFNTIIAAFLVACLAFENPLSDLIPVFANSSKEAEEDDEEKVEYVSDVKLFYSMDSRESAITNCQNNGYIPINADLNEGTGANFVVMGYKKTYSRSDAIRSLRLLSMSDQAKIKDYSEYEEEFKKTHSSFVDTIEATANEFIVNYKEGSPKAKQAFDVLNLVNIPEKNNMLLGKFIISGEANHSFFEKIVFNSSASTINSIFTALNYGTSAYNNEVDSKSGKVISQSWAELVKDNYLWEELEEDLNADELKDLDAEYEEDAMDFHKHLQNFATNYENVLASYDSDELNKEINDLKKEDEEDLTECDVETTACQSATIISMYETLNEYEVYDGYPLGEYLVDLGIQTSDEVDLRSLYPILDSMTYGQRMAMRTGGVEAIINTIGENKEYDIITEKVAYAQEGIEDIIGTKSYSVWMNSNENVRGKKVAYTSEAERDSASQKLIDQQNDETFEDTQAKISTYMQIASGALAVVISLFSVPAIASAIGTAVSFVTFALSVFCYSMGLSSLGAVFFSISGGAKAAILGFSSIAGTIGVVIAVIAALVTAVLFVVGLLMEKSEEDEDLDYDEVPDVVADSATGVNGDYLAYYNNVGSVEDPNQEEEVDEDDIHGVEGIGDVNGRMGFRGWNCLFMSKDPNTGSPIVANHGRGPFMILNNVSTTPRGYDSARTFGESGACNCNSYMKKDLVGGIFIYYLTEDSIKDADGSAVQTSDTTESSNSKNETKQYFKSMIVASADTEAKAKAKLRVKEAVYIWDHNLADVVRYKYSKNEQHCYTYLGYTITSDPDKAITDIRVSTFMNKAQASSIMFGEVSYGCAGTLGYPADSAMEDKECPQDLDGLWYTTDSRAGTPIEVSGLHLKSSHYDAEGISYVDKGWVPVTTFSGVPYNFGSTRDVDAGEGGDSKVFGYRYTCYQTRENNTWNSPSRYLYYEPEVKYTDGTKYLS